MSNITASFNAADIIVLIVIITGVAVGMYRGLLVSLFKMFSTAISIIITTALTPLLSSYVRKTYIYTLIYGCVKNNLGLNSETAINKLQQSDTIQGLDIPEFLKNILLENNNNVVYDILNVDTLNDYISAYISNIITQIIISIIVFIFIFFIMFMIMRLIKILCKIPVIKQCNKLGGGLVGAAYSVIIIWIAFAVLHLFVLSPNFEYMLETIKTSAFASKLYEKDILVNLLFTRMQ